MSLVADDANPNPSPDPSPNPDPSPDPSPDPNPNNPEPPNNPDPSPPSPNDAWGDWKSNFSPELKEDPGLGKFKNPEEMFKSYKSLEKMVGGDKVTLPSKHATDEERAAFFQRIGAPESAEGYDVKFAEGAEVNEEVLKGFKEVAHKAGLLPEQFQALVDFNQELTQKVNEEAENQAKNQLEEDTKLLKKEWGADYERRVKLAQMAVNELGNDELKSFLKESGLKDNRHLLMAFSKMGESLGEDKVDEHGAKGRFGYTPKEAENEMNKILGDFSHPYHNADHPGHKSALEEFEVLMKAKLFDQSEG